MSDEHREGEPTVETTLELPSKLAAQLDSLRRRFGEELIIDLIRKANATMEGKLALCGAYKKSN